MVDLRTTIFGCITIAAALIHIIATIVLMIGMNREDAALKAKVLLPQRLSLPAYVIGVLGWFIGLALVSTTYLALAKTICGYTALGVLAIILLMFAATILAPANQYEKRKSVFLIAAPHVGNILKLSAIGWLACLIIPLLV